MIRLLTLIRWGLLCLVLGVGSTERAEAQNPLEITFMDSGQGDGTLITCPNGNLILVDLGSIENNAEVGPKLRAFLGERVATHGRVIDVVVVTHPDRDHYNLLAPALEGVTINRVIVGGRVEEYGAPGSAIRNWLLDRGAQVINGGNEYHADGPNVDFPCGPAQIRILSANYDTGDGNANNKSIVLSIDYEKTRIILEGDAESPAELQILETYPREQLEADVLKVAHHGSETSSPPAWIEAVNPEFIFISAGLHQGFFHPRCSVLERFLGTFDRDADPHSWACGNAGNGSFSSPDPDANDPPDERARFGIFTTVVRTPSGWGGVYYTLTVTPRGMPDGRTRVSICQH